MAGLLSRAWNAVDPYLPDEQVMGLLGRVMGRGQPQNQPITPGIQQMIGAPVTEPVPAQQGPMEPEGPGASRILWGLLRGETPDLVRDRFASRQQLGRDEAEARQRIDSLNLDPRERAVALLNPGEWSKQNAQRFGAHNVAGGSSLVFGQPGTAGSETYVAPKLVEDQGVYGTQTPDGFAETGRRSKSVAEEIREILAEQDERFRRDQLAETGRHNRAQEGIGQSNAGRGWAAHNARLKGVGGYGTPGVGGPALGASLDGDWEIQP